MQAGPDEVVCGDLLALLDALLVGRRHAGDAQQGARLEGVVQLHQWVAPPEGSPQQRDGVGIVLGFVLLLGHPAREAGDHAQAQLQAQAALEEGRVLVGALIEHIVGCLDGAAVDGRRGEVGRRLPAKERGHARRLGARRVAGAVVRVAAGAVLALETLVGHERWGPAVAGDAGVGRGCRLLRRRVYALQARVESNAGSHARRLVLHLLAACRCPTRVREVSAGPRQGPAHQMASRGRAGAVS